MKFKFKLTVTARKKNSAVNACYYEIETQLRIPKNL
jgi:hypothetical protein